MDRILASALVFIVSAAVLVLEILALRLLAPYVGVTLETYTAIIGVVLGGIAAGAWIGGFIADRVDPRRLLGPEVLLGGILSVASVPVVRALGDASSGDIRVTSVTLAFAAFFLPALVLSAVNPTVVKLQLHDLGHTGGVVGSFTGIGTLGALVGTFATGFILLAEAPTRSVIYGLGGVLALMGVGLWAWLWRRDAAVMAALLILAAGSGLYAVQSQEPCDLESAYSCIRVEESAVDENRRLLWLNDGLHASVDLTDPTYLEFAYTNAFADVVTVAWNNDDPLDSLHIGGGGFTMPRYLAAIRPGSETLSVRVT